MAKKNDSFINEANDLVPKLRDEDNIAVVREEDPFFSLKNTLFNFFQNMLIKVQSEDEFTIKVKNAITEKIDSGEITIPQLMVLLNDQKHDKQNLIDSILAIFKPAPGTGEVSPLIDPKITNTKNEASPFSSLSAQDRNVLDKLDRLIQEAEKNE